MKKSLILLGHLSLIVTAILAIAFYKERVFYTDPGQQIFEMINSGWFKVYANRYSMMINQSLPLMAIKLGLPLKYIAITYSLSFVLLFYLCFLISVYGFKNIGAGLGIAFMPILIRADFGHSISEAWLGIAYSAVFYAVLNYYNQWKSKGSGFIMLFYFIISIIVVINYFIHPITLFTLLFSILLTYFLKREYKSPYIYMVSLIVLVPYLYKFFFPGHVHDGGFFSGLKMADRLILQLTQLPLWKFIITEFQTIYFWGFILLITSAVKYIKRKQLIIFIFSFCFMAFYFIIACITFYEKSNAFAFESRLMPLGFMIVVLFIESIKENKKNIFVISGILLILVFSYHGLYNKVSETHSKRIRIYEKLIAKVQQYPERKFYIYYPSELGIPVNSWGSGAETLMLSSLNGKENSKTIIFIRNDIKIDEGLKYWPCVFMWVDWFRFNDEEKFLNKKYFDLQCTPYRELPYSFIE